MLRCKRKAALVLCLGIALLLVFSSVFIIYEADHVCAAENCEICAQVSAAVLLLRAFALACMILTALFAALFAARKCRAALQRVVLTALTPVMWKIRLNN